LQMVDLGVRHLPVVEAGRVVGILSARDLMVLDLLPA
jgi:CBS domain-containing protein